MEKTVRFYRPLIVEKDESLTTAPKGFWNSLGKKVTKLPASSRRMTIRSSPWFGDAGTGTQRAYSFFRCGRIRLKGDWPPVVDQEGNVIPLAIADGNLFEAAYIVPFGTKEHVAVVGPIRGTVAKSSVESWLGSVAGFPQKGLSLQLEPLLDEQLTQKLAQSVGVSRLEVKLPAQGHFVPADGAQSDIDAAILSSNELGVELDRTLTFSYGNRTKGARAQELLEATRRLFRTDGVSKLEVILMLPHEDGYRTEVHQLFEDSIAVRAVFDVKDEVQPSIEDMLDGIHLAIQELQSPNPTNSAQRT